MCELMNIFSDISIIRYLWICLSTDPTWSPEPKIEEPDSKARGFMLKFTGLEIDPVRGQYSMDITMGWLQSLPLDSLDPVLVTVGLQNNPLFSTHGQRLNYCICAESVFNPVTLSVCHIGYTSFNGDAVGETLLQGAFYLSIHQRTISLYYKSS